MTWKCWIPTKKWISLAFCIVMVLTVLKEKSTKLDNFPSLQKLMEVVVVVPIGVSKRNWRLRNCLSWNSRRVNTSHAAAAGKGDGQCQGNTAYLRAHSSASVYACSNFSILAVAISRPIFGPKCVVHHGKHYLDSWPEKDWRMFIFRIQGPSLLEVQNAHCEEAFFVQCNQCSSMHSETTGLDWLMSNCFFSSIVDLALMKILRNCSAFTELRFIFMMACKKWLH